MSVTMTQDLITIIPCVMVPTFNFCEIGHGTSTVPLIPTAPDMVLQGTLDSCDTRSGTRTVLFILMVLYMVLQIPVMSYHIDSCSSYILHYDYYYDYYHNRNSFSANFVI